jgi:probable rRNA maturation factor
MNLSQKTVEVCVANFQISLQNKSAWNVDSNRILETARFVMGEIGLNPFSKLVVQFVNLDEMERLHIQHMDEPGATDVLSFPMDEMRAPAAGEVAKPGYLGDIILCPEFARDQAAANGNSADAELDMLLTHGILHLLGHDHYEVEEHKIMFGLQNDLLAKLASNRGEI